jgi:hypothetical protein
MRKHKNRVRDDIQLTLEGRASTVFENKSTPTARLHTEFCSQCFRRVPILAGQKPV